MTIERLCARSGFFGNQKGDMDNIWSDAEASREGGDLGQLIYAVRLLEREATLGPPGTGRCSLKHREKDLLGEEEEILYIDSRRTPGLGIAAGDLTPLRARRLARLATLESCPPGQLENELACCRTLAVAPPPPPEALLHAVLPHRAILCGEPEAVLSIACTPGGERRLNDLLGGRVRVFPPYPGAPDFARECARTLPNGEGADLEGVFSLTCGLMVFGDTPRQAYERMVEFVNHAESYLEERSAWRLPPTREARVAIPGYGRELAALRKAASAAYGKPLILAAFPEAAGFVFNQGGELAAHVPRRPVCADQVAFIRHRAMIGREVSAYRAACEGDWQDFHPGFVPPPMDWAPRIVLDHELGLCALGQTAGEARRAGQIYRRNLEIARRAMVLEAFQPLPESTCLDAETAAYARLSASLALGELERAESAMFRGEVALVTGGASGIGKACVEALLRRGAAVATFDVNPRVKTLFDRPDFLGLECDLTDETAVLRCFEALARAYGGLDMLVLNAGIFPAGCRIESLTLGEWQRVMRINLDSNLVVLREAYPLLKQSPAQGRVVVNASKNVLAPGAGAAAYSASKAAVTQMARVAALEWGKDGIRVNMIHPDAVFDTGIWTEEVLKARAAHYGLTVQQYKTRNVLGVELNSHYVGELVAEMLGPRFAKITGAQIPVDGGSDRVI